jgi:hypothetical protein
MSARTLAANQRIPKGFSLWNPSKLVIKLAEIHVPIAPTADTR